MNGQTIAQEVLEARVSEAFVALVAAFRHYDPAGTPASRTAIGKIVAKELQDAASKTEQDPGWIREIEARLPDLTKTELETFRLIGYGMTNREVAGALFISPLTVRTHIKQIHDKLDVKGRPRLAVAAHRIFFSIKEA